MVGLASVAAFVGAAIAIATHGHNGTTQPAGASQTPATTTPTTEQQQTPNFNGGDGNWGATPPDDGQWGSGSSNPWDNQSQSGGSNFGGGGSFNPPSHSSSGGS
jgi:hypothetical protein